MTPGELLTEGYERVYDEIQEGDMIRSLVGGIFPAGDKWIGARLEEMGMAASAVEIWRKPARTMTQQEVIRHVCDTVGLAFHSIGDYTEPSDGFCDKCPHANTANFQHSGKTLKFVRTAVLEKLKRDGFNVAPGFDPQTGASLPTED